MHSPTATLMVYSRSLRKAASHTGIHGQLVIIMGGPETSGVRGGCQSFYSEVFSGGMERGH